MKSSPICYVCVALGSLLLALLIAGTIHTSRTRAMFNDLPALRAELEEMEGEVEMLIKEVRCEISD